MCAVATAAVVAHFTFIIGATDRMECVTGFCVEELSMSLEKWTVQVRSGMEFGGLTSSACQSGFMKMKRVA